MLFDLHTGAVAQKEVPRALQCLRKLVLLQRVSTVKQEKWGERRGGGICLIGAVLASVGGESGCGPKASWETGCKGGLCRGGGHHTSTQGGSSRMVWVAETERK